MRSFFLSVALVLVCSCTSRPYKDLRHPIYMVTDQSFWSGCENFRAGPKACREFRVKQINDGVDQWFKFFEEAIRPRTVIVSSKWKLPLHLVNNPIYLRIESGFCGNNASACHAWGDHTTSLSEEIVFESYFLVTPRIMAHEFGHVLGRGDNDVPIGTSSVMSYMMQTDVLLLDFKMMCALHRECPMVKRRRRDVINI